MSNTFTDSKVYVAIFLFEKIFLSASDTLQEAKSKASGKSEGELVGRDFRTSKPTDYFSPAEEEERVRVIKRDAAAAKQCIYCGYISRPNVLRGVFCFRFTTTKFHLSGTICDDAGWR